MRSSDPSDVPRRRRGKSYLVPLGIAISTLFLWLAVRETNLVDVGRALSEADLIWILPYLAALCGSYWLKAMRWQWLLSSACDAQAGALFAPIMVGHMGNLVLPAQLGELVRVGCVAKQVGISHSTAFSSIIIERIFDLLTVLLIFGVALLLGADFSPTLLRAGTIIIAVTAALTAVAIVYVFRTQSLVSALGTLTTAMPAKLRARLLSGLEQGATGMHAMRKLPVLARVVAYSLLQWACLLLCVHFSLTALGVEIPVSAPLLVLGFTVVSVTLPTSPGFVGAIQIAFWVGLEPFGVGADRAFAASVYYHVLAVAAVIVLGVISLRQMGQTFRRARENAEAIEAANL